MTAAITEDDMLQRGLLLVGFGPHRQEKASDKLNKARFVSHFGCSPVVCAHIWKDVIANEDEIRSLKGFFIFLHFLKCYPKACHQEGIFDRCETSLRRDIWYFAKRVQALKHQKVCFIFEVQCIKQLVERSFLQSISLFGQTTDRAAAVHIFLQRLMAYIAASMNLGTLNCRRIQSSIRTSSIKLR
jgi:hypothetical protein